MDDATFLMAMGGMPSGMAMAVAPEGDAEDEGAAAEPVAEKTHFDVVMKGFDAKAKIKIIKEVRAITSLGLKEVMNCLAFTPHTLVSQHCDSLYSCLRFLAPRLRSLLRTLPQP